jgi:hypothetical protein
VRAPSSASSSGSSSSSTKKKAGAGSTYSTAAEAKQYLADSRSELASAARETAESKTQAARAAHSRAEAAADIAKAKAHAKKGDTAAAKRELADAARDDARAARDIARSKRDAARAGKNKVKAKKNALKAKAVSLALPGAVEDGWILGGNDWHLGCAAVAVANSLLMATGVRVSDEDVLALYLAASGGADSGASILATLAAAAKYGLAGIRPVSYGGAGPDSNRQPWIAGGYALGPLRLPHRALSVELPALPADDDSAVILELTLQEAQQDQEVWDWEPSPSWGDHAAVLTGDSVITWGREVPVTADFLSGQVTGAWSVEWGPVPAVHG